MRLVLFFNTIVFAFCNIARAEYRVFELVIRDPLTNQSRTVISTLDDIQYPEYYHLNPNEQIQIQATWMCWKRSDYFQKPCPNPRALPPPQPAPAPVNP